MDILSDLNKVACELENSGHYKEAKELHKVFIKVADIEKEAGWKDIGKAAIPALALMGNIGNVAKDYKPSDNTNIVQNVSDEDPIEKDVIVEKDKEQNIEGGPGGISERLKKILNQFEFSEIQKILTKKGITKKIKTEEDLDDPEILNSLEDYYNNMNLEKLIPVFDPVAKEIMTLLMNNRTNERVLSSKISQYWNLENQSTRFDSVFMKELNLKLKQVAMSNPMELRQFLKILKNNFQAKPNQNLKDKE